MICSSAGNDDVKKLLMSAIVVKDGVSYCLVGPPASAKSVFLQEMEKGLDDAVFIDGTGASQDSEYLQLQIAGRGCQSHYNQEFNL